MFFYVLVFMSPEHNPKKNVHLSNSLQDIGQKWDKITALKNIGQNHPHAVRSIFVPQWIIFQK